MPKTGNRTKSEQRSAARQAMEEALIAIEMAEAKGNPAFLVPFIKIIIPYIVKAALVYGAIKTGVRVTDALVDKITQEVRKGLKITRKGLPISLQLLKPARKK